MTARERRPSCCARPRADGSEIARFLDWLRAGTRPARSTATTSCTAGRSTDLEGFWSAVAEFYAVRFATPPERVLGRREMPGAEWFPGATLNYAEHARRAGPRTPTRSPCSRYSQTRDRVELTWEQLRDQVARARAGLARLGVGRGDRVVAYLPNIPETLVAFLATASLGAIWASCAPEFGARSVVDRFGQIEPTVLLAVAGYGYGGKDIDRRDAGRRDPRGPADACATSSRCRTGRTRCPTR